MGIFSKGIKRNLSAEFLLPAEDDDVRQGTTHAAIFNLVSTIVGGGVLSLPYALSRAGIVFGGVLLLVVAAASDFSIFLLVSSSRRSGGQSYEEVLYKAFGTAAKFVTLSLLILLTFLCCVAYIILMGDLITPVISYINGNDVGDTGRIVAMCVCTLLVLPLCFLRSLNALRFTSALCMISIAFLSIAICVRAVESSTSETNPLEWSDLKLYPSSWTDVLYSFPIVSVAFLCHFNVLPIHCELRQPTRARIMRVIHWTMTLCFILYFIIGFSGYVYGRDDTKDNILKNFGDDDLLMTFGRVALGLTIMCSFPLLVLPCRHTVQRLLPMIVARLRSAEEKEKDDVLLEHRNSEPEASQYELALVEKYHSHRISALLTTIIVALSLGLAIALPSVVVVWTLMGSTVSICIAYILPASSYLKIRQRKLMNVRKVFSWALIIIGSVLGVLCTYQSVAEIA